MLPPRRVLQILTILGLSLCAAAIERSVVKTPPRIVYLRENPASRETDAFAAPEPPESARPLSASDIVAGLLPTVAEYCMDGKCDVPDLAIILFIGPGTALELFESGEGQFVDVRTPRAFGLGRVPESLNLSLDGLRGGWPGAMELLLPEMPTIVYGQGIDAEGAGKVAEQLVNLGFEDIKIVEGGFDAWRKAGGETVEGSL